MDKHKLKVFLLIFLFSIIWIVSFFVFKDDKSLNNTQENENKSLSKVEEKFDPNNYKDVQSYLKTIKVDWIDLEKEEFYIKNKIWNTEKVQKIDIKNSNLLNENKNQVINDINEAYLNKTIFASWNNWRSGIKMVNPADVSKNAKFFQDLMDEGNRTIKDWQKYKKELESKKNKSIEDIKKLSFIYDVEWNYDFKDKLCSDNKCIKDVQLKISWIVKDQDNKFISDAKVYLLNDNSIFTYTDKDWKYNLTLKTNELSTLRLRVLKDWYSDSISNIYIVFESKEFIFNRDFTLSEPLKIKEFNKNDLSKAELDLSWDISNYKIKTKWIVDINWNNVNPEKITAYLFEYNRNNISWLDNYFHLDIFDNSWNYNWNTFVTYGMPYLILKDEKWQELFISKQNPAIINDNIANIDELLKENQNIAWNKTLTKNDIEKMVSKNDFIYLSNYAKENKIIMPYKWNLNVKKWIWEESPVKFLDSSTAKAETIYYNID